MNSHILVAEDNRPNSILVRTYLSKFGYDCDIVANGEAAVEAALTGAYGLILMDIRMPRMDGLEATRRIRAKGGRFADLPILALTASALSNDMSIYADAGLNDIVAKPIVAADLYSKIQEHLRLAA